MELEPRQTVFSNHYSVIGRELPEAIKTAGIGLQKTEQHYTSGLENMDWVGNLANTASQLLNPPCLSAAGFFLVAYLQAAPSAWAWATFYNITAVLLPVLYVAQLVWSGKATDLHLPHRQERLRPLLLSILFSSFAAIILWIGQAAPLFIALAIANLFQLVLIFLITLQWKISVHSAASAGLAVLGWAVWPETAVFLVPLIPFVAWSRVYLRRHTLAQTIAGTLLGAGITYVLLTFF